MSNQSFVHLSTARVSELIHTAREKVLFCAPGIQQAVAAALVNAKKQLGREKVRVVLDVDDSTARLGYGEFEGVTLLTESDVDVRVEPGLRTCVLVCDSIGYALFTPPMMVELQDDIHVGVNALLLHPEQVRTVIQSLAPTVDSSGGSPGTPELGQVALDAAQVEEVKAALDANPPQKFDLARKVNVFNSFVEFVELRLTGLHIAHHTVQLPGKMLALSDDATARRLLTTFRLVDSDSRVAKDAAVIDKKVRLLRERLTRSLGEVLGNVMLRSKRKEFSAEFAAIQAQIQQFQTNVVERLGKEIDASRKKLVEGLLPAMKKAPPEALTSQLSGKATVDVLRRFLDDELRKVFPEAESLVREMKLEWIPKGVTYETLSNADFQRRVREAFPYENWDKPFAEFEAAPAQLATFPLFQSHDGEPQ